MRSAISSQVPLTTQPPFLPVSYNDLRRKWSLQIGRFIQQPDTGCMKTQSLPSTARYVEIAAEDAVCKLDPLRSADSYFARNRVCGKLIRQSLKTEVSSVAKLRLSDSEKQEQSGAANSSVWPDQVTESLEASRWCSVSHSSAA